MPRTPLPPDTVRHSFDLSLVSEEWLQRLVAERKRPFVEVLNSEIEYVRTFGLPQMFVRRLALDAAGKGSTLRAEVQHLVLELAYSLPKMTGPVAPLPTSTERRRSGANFNGPNHTFLERTLLQERLEFSAALQRVLDFARTYGLPAEPLARLEVAAQARGVSVRDLIAEHLILAAQKLPEPPPEKPAAPATTPRRRRSTTK